MGHSDALNLVPTSIITGNALWSLQSYSKLFLKTFKFSPSDKKVKWQRNSIVQPTTEDAEVTALGKQKLQLPLMVSLAQEAN